MFGGSGIRDFLDDEKAKAFNENFGGRGGYAFPFLRPQHLGHTVQLVFRFLPPDFGKMPEGMFKCVTHAVQTDPDDKSTRQQILCPKCLDDDDPCYICELMECTIEADVTKHLPKYIRKIYADDFRPWRRVWFPTAWYAEREEVENEKGATSTLWTPNMEVEAEQGAILEVNQSSILEQIEELWEGDDEEDSSNYMQLVDPKKGSLILLRKKGKKYKLSLYKGGKPFKLRNKDLLGDKYPDPVKINQSKIFDYASVRALVKRAHFADDLSEYIDLD